MGRKYFVIGTDVSVGKTTLICAVTRFIKDLRSKKVAALKPVETGCIPQKGGIPHPKDAIRLKQASGLNRHIDEINPYRFVPTLPPTIASKETNRDIDVTFIKDLVNDINEDVDITFIESVGGLLTPLTDKYTNLDLIRMLEAEIIIIADNKYGMLNQTLLTYRYAIEHGLKVKALIVNNTTEDPTDRSRQHNFIELINNKIPVIEEFPYIKEGELWLKDKVTLIADFLLV